MILVVILMLTMILGASHQTVYRSLWQGSSRYDEAQQEEADNDPGCNSDADDDIGRKSSDRLSLASA